MPLDLAKIFGGGGSGVPIGGVTYMHSGREHLVTLDSGEVFLRSGFTSRGDEALYPEAYAAMTPYFQGWGAGGSALLSPATSVGRVAEGNGVIVAMPDSLSNAAAPVARYSTDAGATWASSANVTLGGDSTWSVEGLFWDSTLSMFIAWVRRYDSAASYYRSSVLCSANGASWSVAPINEGNSGYINRLNRCGPYLIAVGFTGSSPTYSAIWTSTDAIAWTSRYSAYNENGADKVALVGSTYIAMGGSLAYTSPDAITWTKNANGRSGPALAFKGLYLIAFGTSIISTTDAITYTTRATTVGVDSLVVANGVVFALTTSGVIYASADGVSWRSFSTGAERVWDVLWLASINRWCMFCASKVLMSADTYTWVCQETPPFAIDARFSTAPSGLLALVNLAGATARARSDSVGITQEYARDGSVAYMRVK